MSNCNTCRDFVPSLTVAGWGECKAKAPLPVYFHVSPGHHTEWKAGDYIRVVWPLVDGLAESCRDYKA